MVGCLLLLILCVLVAAFFPTCALVVAGGGALTLAAIAATIAAALPYLAGGAAALLGVAWLSGWLLPSPGPPAVPAAKHTPGRCGACGHHVPPTASFCPGCGGRLVRE